MYVNCRKLSQPPIGPIPSSLSLVALWKIVREVYLRSFTAPYQLDLYVSLFHSDDSLEKLVAEADYHWMC